MHAVQAALQVLGWFQNLGKDEIPPEEIWHHPERLEEWFAAVEQRRKAPREVERVDDPDDGPGERNEFLTSLRGHRG